MSALFLMFSIAAERGSNTTGKSVVVFERDYVEGGVRRHFAGQRGLALALAFRV